MSDDAGGSGKPRIGQIAMSYDPDQQIAVKRAMDQFRWFTSGWKAAYVLAVRTVGTGLAMVFIWSSHPLYSWYGSLSDQVIGGAIMFTEGSLVTLIAFAWLFLGWIHSPEPKAQGPEALTTND
jgi:hypothetical protein